MECLSDCHYNDVIMDSTASQITSLTIVYWAVYSGADQRNHQSSASLGTGELPAQMTSNAENVSIWWRHHVKWGRTWSMGKNDNSWWRREMETFSALLAICAGNSPVPGEIAAQRPVTWSFDVFFDLRLNKRLSKQSWGWWFETLSRPLLRHCNDIHVLWRFTHKIMIVLNIWHANVDYTVDAPVLQTNMGV